VHDKNRVDFSADRVGARQKPSRFFQRTESVQDKNRVDFSADRVGANKNRVGFIDAIALPVVITTHSHINDFETNGTPY